MKSFLSIIVFAGLILLAACSGKVNTDEKTAADTTNQTLPVPLQKLNEQITADPNSADLLHQRAKYYLDAHDYNAGLVDMKKVISIDSSKAEYYITLSDIYFLTNQTGASKTALEKSISLDAKNVEAMLKLAEIYYFVTKYDKCFEYINMALKIDKYNAKAYFMKGMAYKELKDTAKAISSMQTAVEQDQRFYNAYMQLGLLNAAQKNPIAVEYYKNALRIHPNSVETWYGIGKYYQDISSWDKAIEAYDALLKIDPKNKNANFNLGVIYFEEKKDYVKSLQFYTAAINSDPAYADAYYARGLCFKKIGDKKSAELDFKTCLKINPKHGAALNALKQI